MDRNSSLVAGGLPDQRQLLSSRAVFTPAYAIIPGSVLRDIVSSALPEWRDTRLWVLARPLSGFAETFSQYYMEVSPGGGSEDPEPDPHAQSAIFVTSGTMTITTNGVQHRMVKGSFAFIPAGQVWQIINPSAEICRFQWIRKKFEPAGKLGTPPAIFTHEDKAAGVSMCDEPPLWGSVRFIDPSDLRYDMHINIVWFEGGATIPFMETHVMEHGIYILEGKAVYRLNSDWVEVEAGDFLWLRAFCPQALYAGGPDGLRYLLYKDVNRHMKLL